MKRFLLILGILILAATVLFYRKNPLITTVEIRGVTFTAEVAATEAEKALGLGYRQTLSENHGMIFPYDHKEQFSYWMKGMQFPIDILWINDNVIADITKNVPLATGSSYPSYAPNVPVNKVFEINAGLSDKYGFEIGDLVVIQN